MSIMMSQILKFVDFTKTQTFRYLENKALFFLQIKKIHQLHIKGYFMANNTFAVDATFNSFMTEVPIK